MELHSGIQAPTAAPDDWCARVRARTQLWLPGYGTSSYGTHSSPRLELSSRTQLWKEVPSESSGVHEECKQGEGPGRGEGLRVREPFARWHGVPRWGSVGEAPCIAPGPQFRRVPAFHAAGLFMVRYRRLPPGASLRTRFGSSPA